MELQDIFNNLKDALKKKSQSITSKPQITTLIESISSKFKTIIDILDRAYSQKLSNIQKQLSTKVKSIKDKIKDLMSSKDKKDSSKLKPSIFTSLINTKDSIVDKLKTTLSPPAESEDNATNPQNQNNPKESFLSRVTTSIKDKTKQLFTPKDKTKEEPQTPPKDKKSIFDKMFTKSKEKQNKRQKEIEEEKKASLKKLKQNTSKSSDFIGKLITKLGSLGASVASAITGPILGGLKWLGGFLLKGIVKYVPKALNGLLRGFFRLLPGLSGGIAKGTSAILSTGARVLTTVGRFAIPALAKGAAAIGSSVLSAGGALLASPVGVAVGAAVAAGLVIYGGYKLYKYLTRNNIAEDIYGKLTLLRLYLYGFNEAKKEHFSKVFDLEMFLKNRIVINKTEGKYSLRLKTLTKEDQLEILKIFSIDENDKDKVSVLNNWLNKRFLPVFKEYVLLLKSSPKSPYLDELDKLDFNDISSFVSKLKIPTSVLSNDVIPTFEDTKSTVTVDDIETLKNNIALAAKLKIKENIDKELKKKLRDQNKEIVDKINTPTTATSSLDKTAAQAQNKAVGSPTVPTPSQAAATTTTTTTSPQIPQNKPNTAPNESTSTSTTTSTNTTRVEPIYSIAPKEEILVTDKIASNSPILNPKNAQAIIDNNETTKLNAVQAINLASSKTGVDPNIMFAFAKKESSLNPIAKAPTSSAGGLFQFIDSTWKTMLNKYGAKYNIPPNADKFNPYYNSVMGGEFIKENIQFVKPLADRAGIPYSAAAYIAHHYGPAGARTILNKAITEPNAPLRSIVPNDVYRANTREIGDHTAISYVHKKVQEIENFKRTPLERYKAAFIPYEDLKSKRVNLASYKPDTSSTGYKPNQTYTNIYSDVKTNQTPTSVIKTTPTPPTPIPTTPRYEQKPAIPKLTPPVAMEEGAFGKPNPSIGIMDQRRLQSSIYQPPTTDTRQTVPTIVNNVEFKSEELNKYMSESLKTLVQIASILTSIDSKFDLNKLKEAIPKAVNNTSVLNAATTDNYIRSSANAVELNKAYS